MWIINPCDPFNVILSKISRSPLENSTFARWNDETDIERVTGASMKKNIVRSYILLAVFCFSFHLLKRKTNKKVLEGYVKKKRFNFKKQLFKK